MIKLIIGVVIAAIVLLGGFMILDPIVNNNTVNTTDVNQLEENTFSYTIEGEINKPGTYSLNENITMDELIIAAGGLTSNADVRSYFDTTQLVSGSTYYIGGLSDSLDICSTEKIHKVNINADDADTLMNVSGITTSIATSIVSYRAQNGEFTTLEDLLEVYGIGNATYRKIRNYVILHE